MLESTIKFSHCNGYRNSSIYSAEIPRGSPLSVNLLVGDLLPSSQFSKTHSLRRRVGDVAHDGKWGQSETRPVRKCENPSPCQRYRWTDTYTQAIAASPFLPKQHHFSDTTPTRYYEEFVKVAGCSSPSANYTILDCLRRAGTESLQNASYTVSTSAPFGNWAFLPVTDGTLIPQSPSQQLFRKKLNGQNILVSVSLDTLKSPRAPILSGRQNTADEGPLFVPSNISSQDDLIAYIHHLLPKFSREDVDNVMQMYPSPNGPVRPSDPRFATTGLEPPSAIDISPFATGQQQRANVSSLDNGQDPD